MKTLIFGVISTVLAGCGLAQQTQISSESDRAKAAQLADVKSCGLRFPDRTAKPVTPLYQCLVTADAKWQVAKQESVGNPSLFVAKVAHAEILEAASRYDSGAITPQQLELEVTRSWAKIGEATSADTAEYARMQQDQAQRSREALLAAGAVLSTPKTTTTTCDEFMNTVTCRHR